jgi:hypothetical protein
MQSWKGWPLERLLYLFLGVAFAVLWLQIFLFHGVLAGFEESPMYGPVFYTPLMVVAALTYAAVRSPLARKLFLVLFTGGVLVGAFGVYFHAQGVAEMPGGFTLENMAAGPPVLLPLTYAAVSLLGVLTALWHRIRFDLPRVNSAHPGGMPATHLR